MTQLAWDTYMDTQAVDTAQRDTGVVQDTGLLHRSGAGDTAGLYM